MACLPDEAHKQALFEDYVSQGGICKSQNQFNYSSAFFYNRGDLEQSMKFADLFFANVKDVFENRHRDYAQIFFQNLSPIFLGQPSHLERFKQIHEEVVKAGKGQTHFIKLLQDEIDELTLIIQVQSQ